MPRNVLLPVFNTANFTSFVVNQLLQKNPYDTRALLDDCGDHGGLNNVGHIFIIPTSTGMCEVFFFVNIFFSCCQFYL